MDGTPTWREVPKVRQVMIRRGDAAMEAAVSELRVYECSACGALVSNLIQHDIWHGDSEPVVSQSGGDS